MTISFLFITLICFVGYLTYRFGMVSRSANKSVTEFIGGSITFLSFVAVVYFIGWGSLFWLALAFWIVITPIVELFIGYFQKSYHLLDQEHHEARRHKVKHAIEKERARADFMRGIEKAKNRPYLILSTRDEEGFYHVFLVNQTDKVYKSVKMITGAFASDGNNLLETSKAVFEFPDITPHSCIEIDKIEWRERDFTVWYKLDFVADGDVQNYFEGSVGKSHLFSDKDIGVFSEYKKEGWIIWLSGRSDEKSIDDMTKGIDMESKYVTYGEDEATRQET